MRLMSLEENSNCEYTHASFRLVGPDLVPATIERRTGLTGSGAEKNQLRRSRTGRGVRQPTGVWFISSEGQIGSTSLERHLLYLLDILEPQRDTLREVMSEQSLQADFSCYWVSATGQGGPAVGPTTLRRASDLSATLGFEFHGPFGDE